MESNAPLKIATSFICKDTGAILQDYQIKKVQMYGGERVEFKTDEMIALKNIGDAGMRLHWFRGTTNSVGPLCRLCCMCLIGQTFCCALFIHHNSLTRFQAFN